MCFCKVMEVLPQVSLSEQVLLERGSVVRPGGHNVFDQGLRCILCKSSVFHQYLSGQPWSPERVVGEQVQVCSSRVGDLPVEVHGLGQSLGHQVLLAHPLTLPNPPR